MHVTGPHILVVRWRLTQRKPIDYISIVVCIGWVCACDSWMNGVRARARECVCRVCWIAGGNHDESTIDDKFDFIALFLRSKYIVYTRLLAMHARHKQSFYCRLWTFFFSSYSIFWFWIMAYWEIYVSHRIKKNKISSQHDLTTTKTTRCSRTVAESIGHEMVYFAFFYTN